MSAAYHFLTKRVSETQKVAFIMVTLNDFLKIYELPPGGHAFNITCLGMTGVVMTYMTEKSKWTDILTNKLVFYFFYFF